MNEDRLEEIKYRGKQVIYGDPGMLADLNWLTSEVERLRREVELAEARCPPDYKMLVEEQDATIATLREASWKLARRHHEWGHLGSRMATPIEECLIETCVEIVKALDTAQEDRE